MSRAVVDASVAVKWVVAEPGSDAAVAVRESHDLFAPDLLMAECANILWKKQMRGELSEAEARLRAAFLSKTDIGLTSTRGLFERAADLAITLRHQAYDGFYLALAEDMSAPFFTADERLRRTLGAAGYARAEVRGLADIRP